MKMLPDMAGCNYFGSLEKEVDACVAMTGCVGFEDVEFTIMSARTTGLSMFKWTKEGNVEIIESPFSVSSIVILKQSLRFCLCPKLI